jgi:hypothetical protein
MDEMVIDEGWRRLSEADRAREYSPSSCIDDISPLLEAYATRSSAAREACASAGLPIVEIRYGSADAQTIDLVTPPASGDPTPLVVFIHGGYWQELSKVESFFAAVDCVNHGIAFAAIDYTLAPAASLDEIVAECANALAVLVSGAGRYDIDANRIVVTGSSAGGHLAAMLGLGIDGWRPRESLRSNHSSVPTSMMPSGSMSRRPIATARFWPSYKGSPQRSSPTATSRPRSSSDRVRRWRRRSEQLASRWTNSKHLHETTLTWSSTCAITTLNLVGAY